MQRRWLLTGFLAVLLLPIVLIAAAVIFLNVTDLSQHRDIIAQHISKIVGRRLSFDGELELKIAATSSLVVSDIALANVASASTPEMLVIQRIEAEIKLWPLLRGDVHLPHLHLDGAKIALETDATGTGNWERAEPDDELADVDITSAFELPWIGGLLLNNVELTYRDARAGGETVALLDHASIRTEKPASPTTIDIVGQINGNPVEINGRLGLPTLFTADMLDLPLELNARVLGLEAAASGSISGRAPAPAIDLSVQAEAASLTPMREVFGAAVPDVKSARLKMDVKGDQDQPVSAKLNATAGNGTLNAELKLQRDARRPKLTGTVAVSDVDVVHWWAPLFAEEPAAAAGTEKHEAETTAPLQLDQPFDLAWLGRFDANVMLSAKRVNLPQMPIKSLQSRLVVDDRLLTIDKLELATDAGTAQTTLLLNAREKSAAVNLELKTSAISLGKLQVLADNTRLTHSRAEAEMALKAQGDTAGGLIQSVQGSVLLHYSDPRRKQDLKLTLARKPEQTAASKARVVVTADGEFEGHPVQLRADVIPPRDLLKRSGPYQIDMALQAFGVTGKATGTAAAPYTLDGLNLAIEAQADDLDTLRQVFGRDIPEVSNTDLSTRLQTEQSKLRLSALRIGLADGHIDGWLVLDTSAKIPDLEADLVFTDLNLQKLLPAQEIQVQDQADQKIAAQAEKADRVLPDEPLPFAMLSRARIKAALRANNLAWHDNRRLHEAEVQIDMAGGNVSVALLKLSSVKGEPVGYFVVDASGEGAPVVSLKLTAQHIELGEMLTTAEGTAAIDGPLAATVSLEGQGQSVAQIMGTLNGNAKLLMEQGRADAKSLDLFVGGLTAVIGTMFKAESEKTEIECAIYDLKFDQGILTPQLAVLDTKHATVLTEGQVDLKQEKLNLRIVPHAKGVTLSVATPVRLKGTLSSPDVDIEAAGAILEAGELWANVVYPPTALLRFSHLADGKENPCVTMVAEKAGIPVIDDVGKVLKGTVKGVGGAVKGVGSGLGKFVDAIKDEAGGKTRTDESVEADADKSETDELDDPDLFMDY